MCITYNAIYTPAISYIKLAQSLANRDDALIILNKVEKSAYFVTKFSEKILEKQKFGAIFIKKKKILLLTVDR